LAWPAFSDPAGSDPILTAALWIGLAAVALTALLVLQILVLRLRLRRREQRSRRAVARWRPVLAAASANLVPPAMPQLTRADQVDFIRLWLHYQASLRGHAREGLNHVARVLNCGPLARRMLVRGDRAERLLAILMLGHLGERAAVPMLRHIVRRSDRLLALHASSALVQIDPQAAARDMAPELVFASTWTVREVVNVLEQARVECEPVMRVMLNGCTVEQLPRLLQVMEGLRYPMARADLEELLSSPSVEVLVCALRSVNDPPLRWKVLALCGHGDWRVRMHAAKALGRVGRREDVDELVKLLSDREWWVRYRTAQVLAGLPFLKSEDLARIARDNPDRYAGDMLRQVGAEQELA
jgi:hypothetical protein